VFMIPAMNNETLIYNAPWHLIPCSYVPPESMINIIHTILSKTITSLDTSILSLNSVSQVVESQLLDFITKISKLCSNETTYHTFEHTYHMFISAHTLLELMLKTEGVQTYGIKTNTMLHFAFLFSALIMDVDHPGMSNRMLEEDRIAIIYNDQSSIQQNSLATAFRLLLRPDYDDLRKSIFYDAADYAQFRRVVIDLVLSTDIESPERIQIAKSKWKEAFGDPSSGLRGNMTKKPPPDEKKRNGLDFKLNVQDVRDTQGGARPLRERFFRKRGSLDCCKTAHDDDSDDYMSLSPSASSLADEDEFRKNLETHPVDLTFEESVEALRQSLAKSVPDQVEYISSFDNNETETKHELEHGVEFGVDLSPAEILSRRGSEVMSSRKYSVTKSEFEDEEYNGGFGSRKSSDNDLLSMRRGSGLRSANSSRRSSCRTVKSGEGDEQSKKVLSRRGSLTKSPRKPSVTKSKFEDAEYNVGFGSRKSSDNDLLSMRRDGGFGSRKSSDNDLLSMRRDGGFGSRKSSHNDLLSMRRGSSANSNRRSSNRTVKDGEGDGQSKRGTRRSSEVKKRKSVRRFSNPTISATSLSELRLGIRRALDFTDGVVDHYPVQSSRHTLSIGDLQVAFDDEIDPLRASAVLELMMAVVLVAPMMQSWDVYKKWQMLLFFEQKSASAKGRVDDPDLMWFSDQVTLFDSYVVPLANKVDACDVFYKEEHGYFVNLAANNRTQWMNEGPDIIEKMINEWDCYISEYDPF